MPRRKRTLINNVRVKILPLQPWMKRMGNPYAQSPQLETETPRFNRDGYYLDHDVCWFEYKGIAYLYIEKMFRHTFKQIERRSLSIKERQCLLYLQSMKLTTKEQNRLLYDDKQLKSERKSKFYFYKKHKGK